MTDADDVPILWSSMDRSPLVVGAIALVCAITIAAAVVWLATVAGIPSETAVPLIVVLLLALRLAVRRKQATNHQP